MRTAGSLFRNESRLKLQIGTALTTPLSQKNTIQGCIKFPINSSLVNFFSVRETVRAGDYATYNLSKGWRHRVTINKRLIYASSIKSLLLKYWQNSECELPILYGVKLRLKGKTLRIRRLIRRRYFFKIGTSHPSTTYLQYGVFMRHKTKQKMKTWSYSHKLARKNAMQFNSLKKINIYHGRGVRPVRFLLFKKEGKVSAYR